MLREIIPITNDPKEEPQWTNKGLSDIWGQSLMSTARIHLRIEKQWSCSMDHQSSSRYSIDF